MNGIDLLNTLKRRGHFTLIKNAISANLLPTSNSWDKTIVKITPILTNHDTAEDAEIKLKAILMDSILYANKSCQLYKTVDGQATLLIKSIIADKNFIQNTEFSKNFPLSLDVTELIKQALQPTPTYIHLEENKITIIYCSKRYFTSREDISMSTLSKEAQQELLGYDVLVGVKRDVYQAYDSICIDGNKNLITINVDRSDDLSTREIASVFRVLPNLFFESSNQYTDLALTPVNLFPAIKKLYETLDGKVVELGHLTNTASKKQEKMKFKKDDLRREAYHKGGKEAVNNLINCYYISKTWIEGELHICGQSALISNSEPTIFIANIHHCIGNNSYHSILDKLLTALG